MNRHMCLYVLWVCVLKGCVCEAELGTKCLALQVCVPVVVGACEPRCGGGYVTAVMMGCGGWRHECVCTCVCVLLQASVSLAPDRHTLTHPCTQSTINLISDFTSHAARPIRRMTSGRVSTCQVRMAELYEAKLNDPQPTSSSERQPCKSGDRGGQVQVEQTGSSSSSCLTSFDLLT